MTAVLAASAAPAQSADELISQGYTGYLSGHTHHPELPAHGLADPRWVDDASFDIARHVHELSLVFLLLVGGSGGI